MNRFVCVDCGKVFAAKQNMDYHMKRKVCERMNKYVCANCGKVLSSSSSLSRHKKSGCKNQKKGKDDRVNNDDIDNNCADSDAYNDSDDNTDSSNNPDTNNVNIQQVFEEIRKLKEQNDTLQKEMNDMKTQNNTQHITNNTNNTNNTNTNNTNTNNINNGTVNNIYLYGLGKEDMTRMDWKELIGVFQSGFDAPAKMCLAVNFNPKYPEFHNAYITNMKNKYAMFYDGTAWNMIEKNKLVDEMYKYKRSFIEANFDDFVDVMTKNQRDALERWLDSDDDHEHVKEIKEFIKLMLYNRRDVAISYRNKIENIQQQNNVPDNTVPVPVPAPAPDAAFINARKPPRIRALALASTSASTAIPTVTSSATPSATPDSALINARKPQRIRALASASTPAADPIPTRAPAPKHVVKVTKSVKSVKR